MAHNTVISEEPHFYGLDKGPESTSVRDAKGWLTRVEQLRESQRWPAAEVVSRAAKFFRGEATHWYENSIHRKDPEQVAAALGGNWPAFKELFKAKYFKIVDTTDVADLWQKSNTQQQGQTAYDFMDRLYGDLTRYFNLIDFEDDYVYGWNLDKMPDLVRLKPAETHANFAYWESGLEEATKEKIPRVCKRVADDLAIQLSLAGLKDQKAREFARGMMLKKKPFDEIVDAMKRFEADKGRNGRSQPANISAVQTTPTDDAGKSVDAATATLRKAANGNGGGGGNAGGGNNGNGKGKKKNKKKKGANAVEGDSEEDAPKQGNADAARTQQRGQNNGGQQQQRPNSGCYICGKTDHWVRQCPSNYFNRNGGGLARQNQAYQNAINGGGNAGNMQNMQNGMYGNPNPAWNSGISANNAIPNQAWNSGISANRQSGTFGGEEHLNY